MKKIIKFLHFVPSFDFKYVGISVRNGVHYVTVPKATVIGGSRSVDWRLGRLLTVVDWRRLRTPVALAGQRQLSGSLRI